MTDAFGSAGAIGIIGSDSKILAAVFKYFIGYVPLAGAMFCRLVPDVNRYKFPVSGFL